MAPWPTVFGDLYLANLVVGFVFVLRDYGQRQVGHRILLATLVAGIITFFMVDKAIALASITAFILSEMTDWAIYSFTKRPLQQRILLARALYRRPKMLLLDEGTANLDPATEEMIADTIAGMPITRIVIAHRPALIDRAERVFRVEHGRIETVRDGLSHGRIAQSA